MEEAPSSSGTARLLNSDGSQSHEVRLFQPFTPLNFEKKPDMLLSPLVFKDISSFVVTLAKYTVDEDNFNQMARRRSGLALNVRVRIEGLFSSDVQLFAIVWSKNAVNSAEFTARDITRLTHKCQSIPELEEASVSEGGTVYLLDIGNVKSGTTFEVGLLVPKDSEIAAQYKEVSEQRLQRYKKRNEPSVVVPVPPPVVPESATALSASQQPASASNNASASPMLGIARNFSVPAMNTQDAPSSSSSAPSPAAPSSSAPVAAVPVVEEHVSTARDVASVDEGILWSTDVHSLMISFTEEPVDIEVTDLTPIAVSCSLAFNPHLHRVRQLRTFRRFHLKMEAFIRHTYGSLCSDAYMERVQSVACKDCRANYGAWQEGEDQKRVFLLRQMRFDDSVAVDEEEEESVDSDEEREREAKRKARPKSAASRMTLMRNSEAIETLRKQRALLRPASGNSRVRRTLSGLMSTFNSTSDSAGYLTNKPFYCLRQKCAGRLIDCDYRSPLYLSPYIEGLVGPHAGQNLVESKARFHAIRWKMRDRALETKWDKLQLFYEEKYYYELQLDKWKCPRCGRLEPYLDARFRKLCMEQKTEIQYTNECIKCHVQFEREFVFRLEHWERRLSRLELVRLKRLQALEEAQRKIESFREAPYKFTNHQRRRRSGRTALSTTKKTKYRLLYCDGGSLDWDAMFAQAEESKRRAQQVVAPDGSPIKSILKKASVPKMPHQALNRTLSMNVRDLIGSFIDAASVNSAELPADAPIAEEGAGSPVMEFDDVLTVSIVESTDGNPAAAEEECEVDLDLLAMQQQSMLMVTETPAVIPSPPLTYEQQLLPTAEGSNASPTPDDESHSRRDRRNDLGIYGIGDYMGQNYNYYSPEEDVIARAVKEFNEQLKVEVPEAAGTAAATGTSAASLVVAGRRESVDVMSIEGVMSPVTGRRVSVTEPIAEERAMPPVTAEGAAAAAAMAGDSGVAAVGRQKSWNLWVTSEDAQAPVAEQSGLPPITPLATHVEAPSAPTPLELPASQFPSHAAEQTEGTEAVPQLEIALPGDGAALLPGKSSLASPESKRSPKRQLSIAEGVVSDVFPAAEAVTAATDAAIDADVAYGAEVGVAEAEEAEPAAVLEEEEPVVARPPTLNATYFWVSGVAGVVPENAVTTGTTSDSSIHNNQAEPETEDDWETNTIATFTVRVRCMYHTESNTLEEFDGDKMYEYSLNKGLYIERYYVGVCRRGSLHSALCMVPGSMNLAPGLRTVEVSENRSAAIAPPTPVEELGASLPMSKLGLFSRTGTMTQIREDNEDEFGEEDRDDESLDPIAAACAFVSRNATSIQSDGGSSSRQTAVKTVGSFSVIAVSRCEYLVEVLTPVDEPEPSVSLLLQSQSKSLVTNSRFLPAGVSASQDLTQGSRSKVMAPLTDPGVIFDDSLVLDDESLSRKTPSVVSSLPKSSKSRLAANSVTASEPSLMTIAAIGISSDPLGIAEMPLGNPRSASASTVAKSRQPQAAVTLSKISDSSTVISVASRPNLTVPSAYEHWDAHFEGLTTQSQLLANTILTTHYGNNNDPNAVTFVQQKLRPFHHHGLAEEVIADRYSWCKAEAHWIGDGSQLHLPRDVMFVANVLSTGFNQSLTQTRLKSNPVEYVFVVRTMLHGVNIVTGSFVYKKPVVVNRGMLSRLSFMLTSKNNSFASFGSLLGPNRGGEGDGEDDDSAGGGGGGGMFGGMSYARAIEAALNQKNLSETQRTVEQFTSGIGLARDKPKLHYCSRVTTTLVTAPPTAENSPRNNDTAVAVAAAAEPKRVEEAGQQISEVLGTLDHALLAVFFFNSCLYYVPIRDVEFLCVEKQQ